MLAISRVTASTIAESEYIKNPCMQKVEEMGLPNQILNALLHSENLF